MENIFIGETEGNEYQDGDHCNDIALSFDNELSPPNNPRTPPLVPSSDDPAPNSIFRCISGYTSVCTEMTAMRTRCKEYFLLQVNNQDTVQKYSVFATLLMEFYRVLMGSLLLSFVPQKCGDHVCGVTENISTKGAYYIAYISNIMTLCIFALVYLVEIKRENRLIAYLDVNTTKPTDAISVAIALRALPQDKRENILYIDKIYQQVGCCAISVYVFNTVISAIVIYENYLDNKTVTAFLTNVLFIGAKVSEIYSIANTDNNIFYSAYLKHKMQYNDVDPDKIGEDFGQSSVHSRDEY